jgi:hypothetical protein
LWRDFKSAEKETKVKLYIFEASTSDWDAVEEMQAKVNKFLSDNPDYVVRTNELVVGIFLVVFVYVKLPIC